MIYHEALMAGYMKPCVREYLQPAHIDGCVRIQLLYCSP